MGESWIVDMRRLMEEFDRPPIRTADMGSQEFERSIYMVPESLKDINADAYMPKVVSLGPYHRRRQDLLPMEQHKSRACAWFLKRLAESSSAVVPEDVASAMRNIVDLLLSAYGLHEEEINKEEFLRIMIVDGCFVLNFLCFLNERGNDFMDPVMDPVFECKEIKLFKRDITRDMMLLENQLPLLALYTLAAFRGLQIEEVNVIIGHLYIYHFVTNKKRKYLHILDLIREQMTDDDGKYSTGFYQPPPMTKLSSAGISLRSSMVHCRFKSIKFTGRVLLLPLLKINDETESLLLNFMCFERLHPTTQNDVTAYVFFMEGIIRTSEGVVLLRKKHIITGWVGYDDKVVNMFKQIIEQRNMIDVERYQWKNDVGRRLNIYCERVLNKFRANFMHAFWKDPISFSTFWLGVVVILALTLIQTIFAILSYKQAQNGH